MSPPEGRVVVAYAFPRSSPVRPGILNWDTGENRGDGSRNHEQHAVDYGANTQNLDSSAGKHAHEKAYDGDLRQDDGWNVGNLGDPGVLRSC